MIFYGYTMDSTGEQRSLHILDTFAGICVGLCRHLIGGEEANGIELGLFFLGLILTKHGTILIINGIMTWFFSWCSRWHNGRGLENGRTCREHGFCRRSLWRVGLQRGRAFGRSRWHGSRVVSGAWFARNQL